MTTTLSSDWKRCRVKEKDILRDFREKLGLSQQQVANKAKIQLRQYQRFETGERALSSSSFRIACAVLKALELSADKYIAGDYVFVGDTAEAEWDKEHVNGSHPTVKRAISYALINADSAAPPSDHAFVRGAEYYKK